MTPPEKQQIGQEIRISAMIGPNQLNGLDEICIAIRKAQPNFRIRRSELMRAIFEAVIPVLKKADWSDASDHETLVAALERTVGQGR